MQAVKVQSGLKQLTDSERLFIKENWNTMGRQDLLDCINSKRARKISMNTLKIRAYHLGVFETTSAYYAKYSERPATLTVKDKALIRKEYRNGKPIRLILLAVNLKKDTEITECQITEYINHYVIAVDPKSNEKYSFSESEVQFIRQNAGKISVQKIIDHLNQGRQRKIASTDVLMRYMRLWNLPTNSRKPGKKVKKERRIHNRFSAAEESFIFDNYKSLSQQRLANHINSLRRHDDIVVTRCMIEKYLYKHDLLKFKFPERGNRGKVTHEHIQFD